jgi:hypothetical protein
MEEQGMRYFEYLIGKLNNIEIIKIVWNDLARVVLPKVRVIDLAE